MSTQSTHREWSDRSALSHSEYSECVRQAGLTGEASGSGEYSSDLDTSDNVSSTAVSLQLSLATESAQPSEHPDSTQSTPMVPRVPR